MKNEKSGYFPIIGLEIHCELKTRTKMFCACLNNPSETLPNKNICPICTGQPGSLPVPNKKAIEYTIKAGLALNCQIAEISKFDRKNYYYPDLPKGYQISQYDQPFCANGFLELDGHKIRIRRIHLEEDTGKLIHDQKDSVSLIDFNRSGVPLMELVTEADIRSGEEASYFAKTLQILFKKYLQISEADMEKGQLRVEANISLSTEENPAKLPDYKVEIKNLNSFKAVREAINFEIQRQESLLKNNEKIKQETRGWNENKKETFSQRFKEEAEDYRYFPEPDIPLIKIQTSKSKYQTNKEKLIDVEAIKKSLPELPWQRKKRFIKEYQLPEKDAEFFVWEKEAGDYFEEVISEIKTLNKNKEIIKLAANYIISRLQKLILASAASIEHIKISPENFAEFINLIAQGRISSAAAQVVLEEMFKTGADPDHIIDSRGLAQLSDAASLEPIIKEVIKENSKAVAEFKSGKQEILMFLVGQVMKKTQGKANPIVAKEMLLKSLRS